MKTLKTKLRKILSSKNRPSDLHVMEVIYLLFVGMSIDY